MLGNCLRLQVSNEMKQLAQRSLRKHVAEPGVRFFSLQLLTPKASFLLCKQVCLASLQMCVLLVNYSIEMVFGAVSFSSFSSRRTCSGKWEIRQQRIIFVCLPSCVGHHVRSLPCWYGAQNLRDHLWEIEDGPNTSPSPFVTAV